MELRDRLEQIKDNKYIRIFLLYFIVLVLVTKFDVQSIADASRMATVKSLVEDLSFTIDNTQFENSKLFTADKYFYNNHFYSDKPPLPALMGAAVYFILKNFGINFSNNFGLTCYAIVLSTVGVLSCLSLVYFHKILLEIFKIDENWANITTFLTATATLILPYSLVLNNHILAASFITISFYYLLKFVEFRDTISVVSCGIWISLAGSIDITCFLFIPFFLLFLASRSLKIAGIFLLSCLPVIISYLSLNVYVSGSIVPPAMNAPLWDYPGSLFGEQNLSGVASQKTFFGALKYAFSLYLGSKGLFSHTPILLFSVMGMATLGMQKKLSYKIPYFYALAACLTFMLLYTLRTVDYGGYSYGVRWFVTPMPLLCLPLSQIGRQIRSSRLLNKFFVVIAFMSIALSLAGTYNPYTEDLTKIPFLGVGNTRYTFAINFMNIVYEASPVYKLRLIASAAAICFLFYKLMQKIKQNPPIYSEKSG